MTITLAPNAVYRLLRVSLKVCSSSKSEHFFLSVLSGRFFIFLAIVSFIFYSQFTFFCSFYSALVIECVCVGWPNHSRNSNRIELMFNRLMQDAQSVMSNCYCILFLGSTSYMRNLRLFRRCFYHFFFFFGFEMNCKYHGHSLNVSTTMPMKFISICLEIKPHTKFHGSGSKYFKRNGYYIEINGIKNDARGKVLQA